MRWPILEVVRNGCWPVAKSPPLRVRLLFPGPARFKLQPALGDTKHVPTGSSR